MCGCDVRERIKATVLVDANGCWLWQGYVSPEGYGRFRHAYEFHGLSSEPHRVAYEVFVGPIPAGLHVDHLCHVRHCANPDHLEPVTPRENNRRSPGVASEVNRRKTHCPAGHPYDETNTYRDPTGRRHCRACGRVRSAAAKRRKRVVA